MLDGHSRAALETVQSLGRRRIAVDVASEGPCLAFRSRYCRARLSQPLSADAQAFARWLEAQAAEQRYRLLVPSTEVSLRGLRSLPESHPSRRAAVLPSNAALDVALSKPRTWQVASDLDIPVPESRLINSGSDRADPGRFPRVLKPAVSVVSIGNRFVGLRPILARTYPEWTRAVDRLLPLTPVLDQVFVAGNGVGIECLYRDGVLVWHFQHDRVHELPLTGGGSSYRRSSTAEERLLSHATRLLDGLQWHGVAMVEFKGSPTEGFRLMEINPRLWGSLAVSIAAGVDFPVGLWRIATGEEPGPQPAYRAGHYARNLELDFDWLKENLVADHSDPLLLTRPRMRSLLEYGRVVLGKESWDHFDARDWRVWTGVLSRTLSKAGTAVTAKWVRVARLRVLLRRHHGVLANLRRSGQPLRRVLFLCYGNICRSPLAEVYARKLLPDWEVTSSGFHETTARSAPDWYRDVARELGVDLSACRSTRVDAEQVARAQLILLADEENLDRFRREFPDAIPKATLLGLFSSRPRPSIQDPYNLNLDQAREAARQILDAVDGLVTWGDEAPSHALASRRAP